MDRQNCALTKNCTIICHTTFVHQTTLAANVHLINLSFGDAFGQQEAGSYHGKIIAGVEQLYWPRQ